MISNWKQWLFSGTTRRANRRRNRADQFHGQVERLETRTVLSATIGPLPAEMEMPAYSVVVWERGPIEAVVVWESNAIEAAEHSQFAPPGIGDSHPGNSPLALSKGPNSAPVMLSDSDRDSSPPVGMQDLAPNYFVAIRFFLPPQGSLPSTGYADFDSAGPAGSSSQFSGGAGSYELGSHPQQTGQPVASHAPFDPMTPAADLYLSPVANTIVVQSTQPTSVASVVARDVVLRDYTSQSLLLATIGEHLSDKESELFDHDRLDFDGDSADILFASRDADLSDDVAQSLDALKRERDAIDAALSQLHDVKADVVDSGQDAARSAEQQNNAAERETQDYLFPAGNEAAMQSTADQQDGGMVLLATSGDANASAYDLSAVLLSVMQDDAIAPLRIDASVGFYQAFDIGSSESLPAVNAAGPAVQGPAAVRTSAATENSPASKSEQPS